MFHINSWSTLSTDMTSHCCTLLHTSTLAHYTPLTARTLNTDMTSHCSTLLHSHARHSNLRSLRHTTALARQDRQANQLASFHSQLMSLHFIVESNAWLNEADAALQRDMTTLWVICRPQHLVQPVYNLFVHYIIILNFSNQNQMKKAHFTHST